MLCWFEQRLVPTVCTECIGFTQQFFLLNWSQTARHSGSRGITSTKWKNNEQKWKQRVSTDQKWDPTERVRLAAKQTKNHDLSLADRGKLGSRDWELRWTICRPRWVEPRVWPPRAGRRRAGAGREHAGQGTSSRGPACCSWSGTGARSTGTGMASHLEIFRETFCKIANKWTMTTKMTK
jgi:hypothetical protein